MVSKKILCSILTAAMAVSATPFAVFADTGFKDVADSAAYKNAVVELNALGIMEGNGDGTFTPDANFTRAQAAKVLVTALGYGKLTGKGASFTDVDTAKWYAGVVNVANQVGLVTGYTKDGKKVFGPDDNVTYGQLATMVVRALGYSEDDLQGTTWPYNYIAKASELGLLDDVEAVDADAPAKRSDVALIADKTMNTPTKAEAAKVDSTGKLVGKTLLGTVVSKLGLSTVTGTVYATSNEDSTVAAGKAQIYNDSTSAFESYDIASSNVASDLGKKVTVYTTKKGAFAAVTSVTGDVVTGTLSSNKLNGDTVPLTGITTVYYNGTKKGSTFTIPDGSTVTYRYTTNADGSKKYDTSVAYATNSGNSYVVSSVDTAKNTITVYADLNGSTSTKTINVVSGATVAGDATKLADIKANDVIKVKADVNDPTGSDTITKEAITVVRKTVVGKITSKSADGTTVYIGGASYTANAASLIPSDAFTVDYTYVLGTDGKIAKSYSASGATTTTSTFDASQYGIYQGVYNTTTGLTKTSNYQFENALGKTVVYPGPAATLDVNGAVYGTNPLEYTPISKSGVTYPTDASFVAGVMDMKGLSVAESANLDMTFTMGAVSNAWGPTNGFDHVAFTIFVDNPSVTGGTSLPGINGTMPSGDWNYEIFVDGWGKNLYAYGAAADANDSVNGLTKLAASSDIAVTVDKPNNKIKISVPKADLGGAANLTGWKVYATTFDGDGATVGRTYRSSGSSNSQWSLGNVTATTPKVVTSVSVPVGSSAATTPVAVGNFGKFRLDSNNNIVAFEQVGTVPTYVTKDTIASYLADDAAIFNNGKDSSGNSVLNLYTGKAFKSSFTANVAPSYVVFGDKDSTTGFAPIKAAYFPNSTDLGGATTSTYVVIPDITTATQIGADLWTVNDVAGKAVKFSNSVYSSIKGDGFSSNYRVLTGLSYDTTTTDKVTGVSDLTTSLTVKTAAAADATRLSCDLTQAPLQYAATPVVYVVGADLNPAVKATTDIVPGMNVKYHTDKDGKIDFLVATKVVNNVNFTVNAPASTSGENLYLVGDFTNWNAGDFWTADFSKYASAFKLTNPTKNADGTYTYTLKGVNNLIVGSKYQVVRDNALTADKWHSLAGDANKGEIKDNYVIVEGNDNSTVTLNVASWRDR